MTKASRQPIEAGSRIRVSVRRPGGFVQVAMPTEIPCLTTGLGSEEGPEAYPFFITDCNSRDFLTTSFALFLLACAAGSSEKSSQARTLSQVLNYRHRAARIPSFHSFPI